MKKNHRQIWLAAAALAAGLFCSAQALAANAELPFYSGKMAKPNVLLLLDLSNSMRRGTDGTVKIPRRIDVLKDVLTSAGEPVMSDASASAKPVYKGDRGAKTTVWDDIFNSNASPPPFVKILLVQYNSTTGVYSLCPRSYYDSQKKPFTDEKFYFVFSDWRDASFIDPTSQAYFYLQWSTYTLDRFLVDENARYIKQKAITEIVLDPSSTTPTKTYNRTVYESDLTGGSGTISFFDAMLNNYYNLDAGSTALSKRIIVRAKVRSSCWWSGDGCGQRYTSGCFELAPKKPATGSTVDPNLDVTTFYFADANDQALAMKTDSADTVLAAKALAMRFSLFGLREFNQYLIDHGVVPALNYNSFAEAPFNPTPWRCVYKSVGNYRNPQYVCGDGTGTCSFDGKKTTGASDGYDVKRTIYLIVENTASATLIPPDPVPTVAEMRDNILGAIPQVEFVTVAGMSVGSVAGSFVKGSGSEREDLVVRTGLDHGEDLAYYHLAPTLTATCLADPYFCNFFGYTDPATGAKVWTGLTYGQLFSPGSRGIIDTYPVRWALAITDSNIDPDFPQSGADVPKNSNNRGMNLLLNFTDAPLQRTWMKEIILQRDLNEDEDLIIADGSPRSIVSDFDNPTGASPIPWALRDLYSYCYSCWFLNPNVGQGTSCVFNASGAPPEGQGGDPYPSMYHRRLGIDEGASRATDAQLAEYLEKYHMEDFNGHVLLNDPYFYFHCRKNNIIFLTDASQTGGGCNIDCYVERSRQYVRDIATGGNLTGMPTYSATPPIFDDTKIYFIGFIVNPKGGIDADASRLLHAMAAASTVDSEDAATQPYMASEKEELAQAFATILDRILEGVFMRSAPALNTTLDKGVAGYFDIVDRNKSSNKEYLWLGHFVISDLAGSTEATGTTVIAALADAASVLNQRGGTSREIFTSWNSVSGDTIIWPRIEFTQAQANADTTLSSYIFPNYPTLLPGYDQNGDGAMTKEDTRLVVEFIRGDTGATYNDAKGATAGNPAVPATPRKWKLGAIYHSTAIAVGPPPPKALPSVPKYGKYAAAKADYPSIFLVGAMDGMLHAFFEDADGTTANETRPMLEEAFGYIPNYLLKSLYPLRNTTQQYLVDGDPNMGIMDVKMREGSTEGGVPVPTPEYCDTSSGSEAEHHCWQTIMYSGLRDGGPAYFSLNISDVHSEKNSAGDSVTIRWEFEDGDTPGINDPILGASWSLPFIDEAQYERPTSEGGTTIDTVVILVFGGGRSIYNKPLEGSWLYIMDADVGVPIRRLMVPDLDQKCDVSLGELLVEGMTVCDMDSVTNLNQVPGDVRIIDPTGEGYPDWIYFGDVQGRVWKANIHSLKREEWGLCLFFDTGDTGYDNLSDPVSACKEVPLSEYQKDSMPSCVDPNKRRPIWHRPASAPSPDGNGYIIYVGTGTIEDTAEAHDATQINYVYALQDTDTPSGCNYATMWQGKIGTTSGWPIQLPPGEKLISPPVIMPGTFNFKSTIGFLSYNPTLSENICTPGTTYKWQVDYSTGLGALEGTEGELVRFQTNPGLLGKYAVLGDMVIDFSLPQEPGEEGGGMHKKRYATDPLLGYYYWWIR